MKWIVDDRDGYKVACSECGREVSAYHLLKDGAAAAKKTVADYQPIYTKEEYVKFMDSMNRVEK